MVYKPFLMVGGTASGACPYKQNFIIDNTVVRMGQGQLVLEPLQDRIFDLGNGIYLTPLDILKGIALGVVTSFITSTPKGKGQNSKAFKNGFVIGGVAGGLEDILDAGVNIEADPSNTEPLTHEIFQSILVQGGIAGLVNLLISKVKK